MRAVEAIKEMVNRAVADIDVLRVEIGTMHDSSAMKIDYIFKGKEKSFRCMLTNDTYDKLQVQSDMFTIAVTAIKFVNYVKGVILDEVT